MRNFKILVFLPCLAAGAFLGAAGPAEAWYANEHAASCVPVSGATSSMTLTGQGWSFPGLSDSAIICPLYSSGSEPVNSATGLWVYGHKPYVTSLVSAKACSAFWYELGGSCSPVVYSPSNAGVFELWVDPSELRRIDGTSYLYITGRNGASYKAYWIQG